MFRHIVLFRVRDDVADPELFAAVDMLRAMGNAPGITSWTVELSLDTRKGRVIVEDGTFVDGDAFTAWRGSHAHQAVAERMSQLADWWVGDWVQ